MVCNSNRPPPPWWRLVAVGGGWLRLVAVGCGWWRLVAVGWGLSSTKKNESPRTAPHLRAPPNPPHLHVPLGAAGVGLRLLGAVLAVADHAEVLGLVELGLRGHALGHGARVLEALLLVAEAQQLVVVGGQDAADRQVLHDQEPRGHDRVLGAVPQDVVPVQQLRVDVPADVLRRAGANAGGRAGVQWKGPGLSWTGGWGRLPRRLGAVAEAVGGGCQGGWGRLPRRLGAVAEAVGGGCQGGWGRLPRRLGAVAKAVGGGCQGGWGRLPRRLGAVAEAVWGGCQGGWGRLPRRLGAVAKAVGGGCQGGWGRLLTNAVEAGTCRRGESGGA